MPYITKRPRAWTPEKRLQARMPVGWTPDGEWAEFRLRGFDSIMVTELDNEPRDTGLCDKNGLPLFYMEVRNPIGFMIFEDEDDPE